MFYRLLAAFSLPILLLTCIPPPTEEVASGPVVVDLQDPTVRHLYDLQNERREDSLVAYLRHPDPSYRLLAARALGSFPSISNPTIDSLTATLRDTEVAVRTQAAYALGQTHRPEVADLLIQSFDQTGDYPAFDATILAAVGKTEEPSVAEDLAAISTYTTADTQLMSGRAWGIYYAALAGNRSPGADRAMVDLVLDPAAPSAVRHPAAYYLQRIAFPVDTNQERRLRQQLRNTIDPVIAMGIIRALGRSGLPRARPALLQRMEASQDWRERVEIIAAFAGFSYPTVRESVIEALRDPHPLVARAAADYLVANGVEADAPLYWQLASDPLPNDVSAQLYRAANRHLSPFLSDYRSRINTALRRAHRDTPTDGYLRADILLALGEFPWNHRSLFQYYQESGLPVERTAAAEALRNISDRADFDDYFGNSSRRVRGELASFLQQMIESGEEGPAYHAAQALAKQPATYRPYYSDLEWLATTLANFRLPQQLETYTEVFAARNALSGRDQPMPPIENPKPRPIDWSLLDRTRGRTITLTTTGGPVTLSLYPDLAPATVSSFLALVEQGYYDDKVFHRVVPNFVVQGGGPRGDGFGSEDFTVRSETPLVHWDRAGLLGMASAGRDTEGVQFFITHRPTPHLDGKYTIFGEVTQGQEIVDGLLPGARIESARLD